MLFHALDARSTSLPIRWISSFLLTFWPYLIFVISCLPFAPTWNPIAIGYASAFATTRDMVLRYILNPTNHAGGTQMTGRIHSERPSFSNLIAPLPVFGCHYRSRHVLVINTHANSGRILALLIIFFRFLLDSGPWSCTIYSQHWIEKVNRFVFAYLASMNQHER